MLHDDPIVADDDLGPRVAELRRRLADAAARGAGARGEVVQAVRIAAATKYLDATLLPPLARAGIRIFAESRLPVLVGKQDALAGDRADACAIPEWHFIGRLQSRQAADVAARVSCIHTLASASAASRLDRFAQEGHTLPRILVQVNVDGDPAKDGVPAGDLAAFLDALPESIRVAGLMTMPAFADRAEASRDAFRMLRDLAREQSGRWAGRHPLCDLSMGTSQDFEVAAQEGATFVRLGAILYGTSRDSGHR